MCRKKTQTNYHLGTSPGSHLRKGGRPTAATGAMLSTPPYRVHPSRPYHVPNGQCHSQPHSTTAVHADTGHPAQPIMALAHHPPAPKDN